MKDDIAIEFNSVSKKFRKGQKTLLKQALLDIFKLQKQEDFWAVKNVSFKIKKGESIGIIGANGSGKSTILKLVAGVLTPTKGQVLVRGRIGPLIEIGAGFHPELTGRENIYLNGTILGLTKKQIDEKFNEIVEFSEIGDFIDTPVKHYSSGMYMRLGFSIAVNVKPDILLVDEILSVGDISFQKKCLEKMKEIKNKGVTLILVSHNLELTQEMCNVVYCVENGKIISSGTPKMVIGDYLNLDAVHRRNQKKEVQKNQRWGDGRAKILKAWIGDKAGKKKFSFGDGLIKIYLKVKFYSEAINPIFGVIVKSDHGVPIFVSNTSYLKIITGKFKEGEEKTICWEFYNCLENGKYNICPAIAYSDGNKFYDWRENFIQLWSNKKTKSGGILNLEHTIKIQ